MGAGLLAGGSQLIRPGSAHAAVQHAQTVADAECAGEGTHLRAI